MKFFVSLLLIALLSYAACLFFPWWSIAVMAFLVAAIIPQKPGWAFLAGFTALFILWLAVTAFISGANDHLLAQKLSQIIIKTDSHVLLIFLTAMIGGLVAGFAALSGSLLRKLIKA
jgi:hypothetical protein